MLASLLTEPVMVEDIFVSGLAYVEDLEDGTYRLVFFAKQRGPHGDENIVKCRLVGTAPAMISGVKTVMTALGKHCCGAMHVMMH